MSVTPAHILQAITVLDQLDHEEPFARYMRQHGADPALGDVLMLPASQRASVMATCPLLPRYVQFSEHATGMVILPALRA